MKPHSPSTQRPGRAIAACMLALSCSSALAADQPIFGEPQFWGFAYDYAVVPGDFDNDGDIDLFSVHPPVYDSFGQLIDPGNYTINFNTDGLGSFSSQTLIDDRGVKTVFAADLNADGALDIVDGLLGVMLGNGDGTFGPIVDHGSGYGGGGGGALNVAFGDMDGDGDTDIIVPNDGPVLLNNGDGTFYTNFVSSDVAAGVGVGIGDFDEDGVLDIATIRSAYDVVTIQLGLGDGFGNPGEPFTVPIGGEYPIDLAVTDMNGDDHLDFVTLNNDTDNISVVLGIGDGNFGSPVTYEPHEPAYFEVREVKVVDVNGDDAPDVMVTSTVYGDAESHEETCLLLNDGNGALSIDQTIVDFGKSYENIAAADFNDDGNTDLATASDLLVNQLPAVIGMDVQPLDDFLANGPAGGPFTPESRIYTLTNNDDAEIEYSVTKNADWISIENGSGFIAAGQSVDVTVRVNGNANALVNGDYHDVVSFTNLTDHHGDRSREVTLEVGLPQLIYSFPLDSDPGWQTEGAWAFGQPTGQGGAHGSPDPTSGYTGDNVYGYNLNGDYPGGLWELNLTTGALDCSNLSHVTLRFQRWLGVRDQPDNVYIRLSTDGVNFYYYKWFNEDEIYDSDWQLVEYDLSPYVDDKPTVYIQWTIGPTYLGGACGWNIDDVEIWGVVNGMGIPGDLNGDGCVDQADLGELLASYGVDGGGDIDGDGDTDQSDLGTLLGNYGQGC